MNRIIIFLFLSYIFIACGVRKQINTQPQLMTTTPEKTLIKLPPQETALKVVENYHRWKNGVQSIHYVFQGNVRIPDNPSLKSLGIISDIHILKDSIILGIFRSSALGFEVLRVTFNKEKVETYSTFTEPNHQVFNFQEVEKKYHVKLDYKTVENLFLFEIYKSFDVLDVTDSTITVKTLIENNLKNQQFILPYNEFVIFPLELQEDFKTIQQGNQISLSMKQILLENEQQLSALRLKILVDKNEKNIFTLDQKSVGIYLNEPFPVDK